MPKTPMILAPATAVLLTCAPAAAQDADAELAKKLANPVANLISVPLQFNHDCCFGPDEGGRLTLNIQPVVPISIAEDWNLIIRTIVPVIYQERTSPGAGSVHGLGDTTQSFFFSPKAASNGVVWAVGPVFLWPTGKSELGAKAWGAGPTALVLKQDRGWTYGMLANHIWSYADLGDNKRPAVSQSFVQPFLSWTSPRQTTISINSESGYNWKTDSWTIPVNFQVSQLYKFGEQRVQFSGGVRVYAASEEQGPNWGLRFTATFLFPK